MMISFCVIRRSVVWILLVAVCSNAQRLGTPILNSDSADSAETDCPVDRLEPRLISIENQMNRMQEIVSTLNNPLIKGNCTIDLAAYGFDDSEKCGYIRTSGGSSLVTHVSGNRGVNVAELDPTTCTVRNWQVFDTHANADDRLRLLETLESATAGTIVIGVTTDTSEPEDNQSFKNVVASFFRKYDMTLTGRMFREKFAFIFQKGYPKKTLFRKESRYGACLRETYALRGSTVSEVTFHRV